MKQIDFSNIIIKDIEGNDVAVDISKDLGNAIYYGARDIAVADLGRNIYHQKKVEMNDEDVKVVRQYIEREFKAIVKVAVLPMLDDK